MESPELHSNVVCTCGLLDKEARDPDSPFTFDEKSGAYHLRLSEELSVRVSACRMCGGRPRNDQTGPECTCGSLAKWAANRSLPIHYNKEMNEYELVGKGTESIFYFCLVCGGRMPKSNRDRYFTKPTDEETRDFFDRVTHLKTLDQVIAVLGEPDADFGPYMPNPAKTEIYGVKGSRRTIMYSRIWKSLQAVIQEMDDGTLEFACAGQYTGKAGGLFSRIGKRIFPRNSGNAKPNY